MDEANNIYHQHTGIMKEAADTTAKWIAKHKPTPQEAQAYLIGVNQCVFAYYAATKK